MFKDQKDLGALPEHCPWDYKILLKKDIELLFSLIYRILLDNLRILREYINKNLKKSYIYKLVLLARSPILFILKVDRMK